MQTAPTLAAVDLACRRGNRRLFAGVNFHLGAGQAMWLRGRNGRGKTSLLRLAAGLAVPESGNILWGDKPVRAAADYPAQRVYVGHANALKDDLSVTESLIFLARMHERPSDAATIRGASRDQLIEAMIPAGAVSPTLEGFVGALKRRQRR